MAIRTPPPSLPTVLERIQIGDPARQRHVLAARRNTDTSPRSTGPPPIAPSSRLWSCSRTRSLSATTRGRTHMFRQDERHSARIPYAPAAEPPRALPVVAREDHRQLSLHLGHRPRAVNKLIPNKRASNS